MQATITIRMDNAAFADDPVGELSRILYEIADGFTGKPGVEGDAEIVIHGGKKTLRDLNGNTCGKLVIS